MGGFRQRYGVPAQERRHGLRIRPRDDFVQVIEFSFPVIDELMGDLHHPVGAALRVGGDEYVLLARNIVAERILLYQALFAAFGNLSDCAIRPPGLFEKPDHRPDDPVDPTTDHELKRQRHELPFEFVMLCKDRSGCHRFYTGVLRHLHVRILHLSANRVI
jgi:hypothetical protein